MSARRSQAALAMARNKPRLATVPEARYSVGEDAVDFMQISQEPPGGSPEMAGHRRRHGSILYQENMIICQKLLFANLHTFQRNQPFRN